MAEKIKIPDSAISYSDASEDISRNAQASNSVLEIGTWVFFALLVSYILSVRGGYPMEFSDSAILRMVLITISIYGGLILLVPLLFYLVFGQMPFQFIRRQISEMKRKSSVGFEITTPFLGLSIEKNENKAKESVSPESATINPSELSSFQNVRYQMEHNFELAMENAKKIYNRSNTFLFAGSLIAIAGVGFFYLQTKTFEQVPGVAAIKVDTSVLVESTIQRFGSLFFIEAIAFFFLRQYSNSMEDYRYYEAVKRQRENQYTVALAYWDEKSEEKLTQFIEACDFNANPGKLGKEETTELLEARKVINTEPDALKSLVDLVKALKKDG